ncbi:octaprenyl-diphosphate synthase [Thermotomaculum hydrothermale]|uniref:Octaprenyl-diphosphate synthase n=1 Tax=Thermotomaculum hydrothermale TaxID=981385 RepID=A0A7R6SZG1_9BACT|nr:octaprenyl-diphosphate synthase [Thermotomaculum hydrothermale]
MRPAFAILFGKIVKIEDEKGIKIGATLELLHNSTLVHDDVIDNADMRRGQKTHNSIWDNTLTVLYGDYMFATAMNIAVELKNIEVLKRIALVSKSLVTGELLQNANAFNFPPKKEVYFEIIKLKTAVLFSACCSLPLIVAERNDLLPLAEKFGEKLGIAFQIVDDCLDFKADLKKLGKPKLIDLPEGKATLPVLLAMENNEEEVIDIVKRVFDSKGEVFEAKDKKRLVNILEKKGYLKKAFSFAKKLISENMEILDNFEDSEHRQTLLKICDFIIDREF